MKDPSRPPNRYPLSEPEALPRQDTPFDPFRFRIQPISMEERRALLALELPSLDPKDLVDTYPPNGRLSAPEKPEESEESEESEGPPQRDERNRAILVVVGLVALAVIAVAIIWPLASSLEPTGSPATTAEATPSDAEAIGVHDEQPMRSSAPTHAEPRAEARTQSRRAPEVSVRPKAPVAVAPQRARTIAPAQPRTAASTSGSSATTTKSVAAPQPDPALPKNGSASASKPPASPAQTEDPTSVDSPRRIDQLLYQ